VQFILSDYILNSGLLAAYNDGLLKISYNTTILIYNL